VARRPAPRGARHAWDVPILGIPTRFESNTAAILAVAREALGPWQAAPLDGAARDGPVVIRVDLTERDQEGVSAPPGPLHYHLDGRRVVVRGAGVHGFADGNACRAEATVSEAVLAAVEHFRYGVLESLTLFILSDLDRQPLHAAAIAQDGAVALLVGSAGVGKSTLTYAALRAGFRVFAEDIVWLQLRPMLRVWGLASRIHLPADAERHFPELAGRPSTLVATGEPKVVVPLSDEDRPATPVTSRVGVCLVDRAPNGSARLELASSGVLRQRLAPSEAGFLRFAGTIGPALDMLAAPGGWRLTLSSRPEDAIPLLREVLSEIAGRPR
jgi:hypothetical protein